MYIFEKKYYEIYHKKQSNDRCKSKVNKTRSTFLKIEAKITRKIVDNFTRLKQIEYTKTIHLINLHTKAE